MVTRGKTLPQCVEMRHPLLVLARIHAISGLRPVVGVPCDLAHCPARDPGARSSAERFRAPFADVHAASPDLGSDLPAI